MNNKLKELTEDELKEVIGGGPSPIPTPVGPNEYDDSGLVSYCIFGVHSRIGTCSTFMGWSRVSSPSPGDICVNASHCGIYVGNNQMIHAPTFG